MEQLEHVDPNLVLAIALGSGVLAQLVARHLRVPSIVLLFAVGVALGPDGAGWVQPQALGKGLFGLVGVGVAIILFEGGLNLELRRLRREGTVIRRLVTLGAAITAVGGALAARVWMQWPWAQSVLFGTLVVVTGPTVISPLLRLVRIKPHVATVLEAEGVLIDPIGAIIAAVTLNVLLPGTDAAVVSGLTGFALRLAFGACAGLAFGFALGWMLRLPWVVPEGLGNIFSLGAVLLLFEGCEHVLSESGVLAVTVAGVVVANIESEVSEELREFKEHLTVGLIALLFVLLAADVRIADVMRLGWPGLATVGALVFLVRPVAIAASTAGSGLAINEKAFLAWMGPRGIVAAAVASLSAAHMEAQGMPGGAELRALVFLTIASTVVVLGGLAPLAARLLRVRAPGRDTVVILSADDLGLALGRALRMGGRRVVFVDRNASHVAAAKEAEFPVVYGNALNEWTFARARPEQAEVAVAMTANDEVNSMFAREARERFGVPATLIALSREDSSITPRLLERQRTQVLFDGPKDMERWNVRLRQEAVEFGEYRYVGPPGGEDTGVTGNPSAVLVLAVRRGEAWQPMSAGFELKPDDTAAVLVHRPEAEGGHVALRRAGWERVDRDGPGTGSVAPSDDAG